MNALEAAVWGVCGAFAIEGLELSFWLRRPRGEWPWKGPGRYDLFPFLIALAIRFAVSAMLAGAAGRGGVIDGAFSAMTIGVAAPLIVEKMAGRVALTGGPDDAS